MLGDFTSEDAQNAYANEDHFRAGRIAVFNALAAYETRRAMLGASAAEREQASQRAAALCNTAADVDTHATMTWVCKGALMLIKEQLSDAQAALHSAILTDTNKEHALTRLAMGCVLVLKKQYADALKHFKAAIQMNPALPAYVRTQTSAGRSAPVRSPLPFDAIHALIVRHLLVVPVRVLFVCC